MAAKFIETIFNTGGFPNQDQFQAYYTLIFQKGIPGKQSMFPLEFTFRADQEFEVPEQKFGVKEIMYRGIKIPKRVPKDESEKKFTIDFRLDENWRLYDTLYQWHRLIFNPRFGNSDNGKPTLKSLISGEKSFKTDLTVRGLKSDKKIGKTFKFTKCFIESLKLTPFKHDSGDVMRVTAVFNFQTFINDNTTLVNFL